MSTPQYDDQGLTSFDKVEAELRGADLVVECTLPDGKVEQVRCSMGHDVAYAKGQLARQLDLPYGAIKLFLHEKLMFDPLSFNDFPEVVSGGGAVNVRVEVDEGSVV